MRSTSEAIAQKNRSVFTPRTAPRYTRFVLLSKKTLWMLAVVLTVAIIIVARINSDDPGSRIVFSGSRPVKQDTPTASDMLRPRYQGLDAENRPYNIIADKAVQQDPEHVALQNVSADMTLTDGAWVALSADRGVYDSKGETIQLTDKVSLFYEGGYEFRTESAFIDAKNGEASGDVPVEGQGPSGTLKANRFKILQRGAILQFHDAVKVVLYL